QMFVGADDRGGDLRSPEQFDMALRHEIRVDLRTDFASAVWVFLGKPDPLHGRMARRHLATKQSDAAASDDREAHVFGRFPHLTSRPVIGLLPRGSSA